MLTSGLTNTPLTKLLLIYTIASSVALSLFDIKHLVTIFVSPHFWPYAQFWRAAVWHLVGFANSTEALFASMLVYHLRVVERAWGRRKMATFLLTTLPYTTLLPPLLLSFLLRPLSLNNLNYLPSGPTALIFALLAQYHASIPHTYRYRIGTTTTSPAVAATTTETDNNETQTADNQRKPPKPSLTLLLSDKSTTYLVAAQLALSQFPAMLLPAALGWIVGFAWRAEILPGLSPAANGFRVPAWVVGERERRGTAGAGGERERYEDLRRRLEGEAAASAEASGLDGGGAGRGVDRRNETAAVVDRLRGDW
ncbi:hypothetical protein PENARI_c028G06080 [Penicillium arizonense]|uniref:Peptidase S54 rhomboid domain-containing protein n=1 Tax=Penicillium arizonense TaxID=1835702 RepID=A0A1F5L6D5_PENAI|nr:hypothetical protein PENARI_c028G06080 [Penicillium arizonense]OGE48481.1 hypothetical protein PENARI_c028G06080 [Penicillium arizonense]